MTLQLFKPSNGWSMKHVQNKTQLKAFDDIFVHGMEPLDLKKNITI